MATEPVGTSTHYDPTATYTPPLGRLPVLGKARAEIDRIRAEAANAFNQVVNRDLAQVDSNAHITAQIAALATRVLNETSKNDAEVLNITGRTANEATATVNDTTRTTNDTNKTNAEVSALGTSTADNTRKIDEEIAASQVNSANDTTRTNNDTSRTSADVTATTIKSEAEERLLDQKTASELAQTSDIIPTSIGIDSTGFSRTIHSTSGSVGVIGNQRALFEKQMDGFDRDAEQKLAKIYMDSWSVLITTGQGEADPAAMGLDDDDIKDVLDDARVGIGMPASP